jgi:hypothetical protein
MSYSQSLAYILQARSYMRTAKGKHRLFWQQEYMRRKQLHIETFF